MEYRARTGLLVAFVALVAALAGLFLAANVQAGRGISVEAVRFAGAKGVPMRALLFRPDTATKASPAPAILAVHGYLNSAEMQGNFATEFARRGYVVLAPDQRGHGGSAPPTFADGFGGPDALAYLRSLPFVDKANIGLEGHSMGGWTVLSAAKAYPDGYKSLILEGSSVGAPFAPEGTTRFPRNLMVVYGTRDEFGGFMWGAESPVATGAVHKLRTLFGSKAPVQPGRLYGSIADGSARLLLTPAVTHPWLHQSAAGITPAIDWFSHTLSGARPIPSSEQIWPWREAGDLLALIAVPIMMAGLIAASASLFYRREQVQAVPSAGQVAGTARSIGELAAVAIVPALLFIPACMAAEAFLGQNSLFRQTFTNQFIGWALLCTVISGAALRLRGERWDMGGLRGAVPTALVAIVPVYGLVLVCDQVLHVNPSWWFLTIRPHSAERLRDFALYTPFFVLSCVTSLRLIQAISPLEQGSLAASTMRAMVALSGGFILFLIAQYGVLAVTGHLLNAGEGLRVIQAINFAVFLLFVGLFGAVSQRATGSVIAGGLVSGIFVGWVLTATQPIGV